VGDANNNNNSESKAFSLFTTNLPRQVINYIIKNACVIIGTVITPPTVNFTKIAQRFNSHPLDPKAIDFVVARDDAKAKNSILCKYVSEHVPYTCVLEYVSMRVCVCSQ